MAICQSSGTHRVHTAPLENIYLQISRSEDYIMVLRAGCEAGQLIEMPLIHDQAGFNRNSVGYTGLSSVTSESLFMCKVMVIFERYTLKPGVHKCS